MISTPPKPKIQPNQRRKNAKNTEAGSSTGTKKTTRQSSKRQTTKTKAAKSQPLKSQTGKNQTRKNQTRKNQAKTEVPLADVFTANATKGLVLLMIMAFNVTTLRNSFLMVAPKMGFSGSIEIDALLYGFAMSVLMIIILFHEEDWNRVFCPGAVVLYVNTLVLILYMKWLDFILGVWLTKWFLSGLLILMPVMGMFIVVVMLKPKK